MVRRPLLLLLLAASLAALAAEEPSGLDAYFAARGDSLKPPSKPVLPAAPILSAESPALVSLAGLPPVSGTLAQSGGSVIFRPADGGELTAFPLFDHPAHPGAPRTPAVRLLEVANGESEPVFLFHLRNAVIETAVPGILGQIVSEPARLAELGTPWTTGWLTLAAPNDEAGAGRIVRDLAQSAYADTLYATFGAPARPIGLVGRRGRAAGRLGEYLPSRDSVSLSPGQMTSSAQLRHALAHELAHRWLRSHPQSGNALAAVMPPIRDSLRYGFRDPDEQLAETLAFAVHFLSRSEATPARPAAALLESYERLVPGTRNAALLLLTFPAYERHSLVPSVRSLRVWN
jgi:hypothetical protein